MGARGTKPLPAEGAAPLPAPATQVPLRLQVSPETQAALELEQSRQEPPVAIEPAAQVLAVPEPEVPGVALVPPLGAVAPLNMQVS